MVKARGMQTTWIRNLVDQGGNTMLYQIVVFLHIIFIFGYLLAHGASAAVAFTLKKERDIQRIRALLDLSAASYPMMFMSLAAFIIFGVIAGFQAHWWKDGWIWLSIALLAIIVVLMMVFGSGQYAEARKAAGIPYYSKGKSYPPEPAKSDEEVFAILAKTNPILLTAIGYGGFAVITWLMTAKPF
jgi:MFS family permease